MNRRSARTRRLDERREKTKSWDSSPEPPQHYTRCGRSWGSRSYSPRPLGERGARRQPRSPAMLTRWTAQQSRPTVGCFNRQLALFSAAHLLCAVLLQGNQPIHPLARKALGRPVGPDDVDGIHMIRLPQAEMGPRIIAAQVAIAGVDLSDPATAPALDHDFGAHSNRALPGLDRPPGSSANGRVWGPRCGTAGPARRPR